MPKIKDIQTKKDLLNYKRLLIKRLEQDLIEPDKILLNQILDLKAEWKSIDDHTSKRAHFLRKIRKFLLSSQILGSVANHREHSFLNLFK